MAEEAETEEVTPQVLADVLSLVVPVMIPAEVIATWTQRERDEALGWAASEHLRASDNDDVEFVPKPAFVDRAGEVAASLALAQLAVEEWTRHRDVLRYAPGAAGDTAEKAQDAITGLLVLLGKRRDERPSWQEEALDVLGAHPEGLRVVDLLALLGRAGPSADALLEWLEQGEARGALARGTGGTWAVAGPDACRAVRRSRPERGSWL